jgi:hypothetical protein
MPVGAAGTDTLTRSLYGQRGGEKQGHLPSSITTPHSSLQPPAGYIASQHDMQQHHYGLRASRGCGTQMLQDTGEAHKRK